MSNESARRGSTGNAEHPVEAPCRRSCNGLQTSCKTRRAQGGPGGEGNERSRGKPIGADGPPPRYAGEILVVPQFYGRARTESLTPLKRVYPIG